MPLNSAVVRAHAIVGEIVSSATCWMFWKVPSKYWVLNASSWAAASPLVGAVGRYPYQVADPSAASQNVWESGVLLTVSKIHRSL